MSDPERGGLSRVRLNNQFGLWRRSEETMDPNVKIGGPDAPYRRELLPTPAMVLVPMRLTRMLKLYVATHEQLTQKHVAQEAGISESSLSRFLSGEQMLDGRAFAALVAWCFGDHKA